MFACCNLFVSFTILFLFCMKSIKPIHSVENVNQTVKRFSHFILPIGSSFNTLQQNYQYPPYYGNPYVCIINDIKIIYMFPKLLLKAIFKFLIEINLIFHSN